MKVLALLPQAALQRRVAKALSAPQFVVEVVVSAKECLHSARSARYDALLVDAECLDFCDVLALVKLLRQGSSDASLIVLEHNLDLDRRLHLFDAGVDDCVRDAFFPSEFAVRLGILIRLRQAASNIVNVLRSGDLELDLVKRRVVRMGKSIDLRPKEFLLLEYLVRNVNRPVTRTMILEHVWHSSFEGLTNLVDVYISALRGKVDRGFPQKLIRTNRGIGYTFTCVSAGQRVARVDQASRLSDFQHIVERNLQSKIGQGTSACKNAAPSKQGALGARGT
jgi:two-component system OmpR family response regulator